MGLVLRIRSHRPMAVAECDVRAAAAERERWTALTEIDRDAGRDRDAPPEAPAYCDILPSGDHLAMRTTISSRCQQSLGRGRRCRSRRAIIGPNFSTQQRMLS